MPSLREIRFEISYVILALGGLLTIFVLLNTFFASNLPEPITNILGVIGDWIVWFVVLGPLLVVVGGYYFADTVRKQREFKQLVEVHSKARFVRNQERLEELAWYLSSEYSRTLEEARKRWGL